MDALVSRELLLVTVDPPSENQPDGQVVLRALRYPNKLTFNGAACFSDDLNSFRPDIGDVVSLYGSKYRYTVSFGVEDLSMSKNEDTSQREDLSKTSSGRKSTPFGVKVAPAKERSIKKVEMGSRRSSAGQIKSQTSVVLQQSGQNSSLLQWAFFCVFSGCLIALVYILARNTENEGEEDSGASNRLLRLDLRRALRGSKHAGSAKEIVLSSV